MVKDYKKKFVEEFAISLKKAKVLGIADIGRMPSNQVQVVRRGLRGKASVKVVKRTLLKKALEAAGLERLVKHITGQPAVIFSEVEAFELFRLIKNMRGQAPAKPGMVALTEVVVNRGGTGLPPGPAIGDLQNAGIPAKIEKGQIVVSKEHIILKAGEKVTPAIANALMKLDMKPFELGLEVEAIMDGGVVFERDVLNVDVDQIRSRFMKASGEAFALAKKMSYPVKEVLEMLFGEAAVESMSLALAIEWISAETIKDVLSKANAQALSLGKIGGV